VTAFPRLREGVLVRRIVHRHETYVVVKEPTDRKYYKFEPWEEDALRLLDGTRDLAAIAREFDALHPEMDVDEQWMVDYVEGLRQTGLLELDEQEKHLVMMDKLKELRKKRLTSPTSTLFEIEFPLFDPDAAMDRVIPWIRWWWAPWFVFGWVAVFVVVLGFLVRHWDLYWAGFFGLFDPTRNTASDWLGLVLMIFVISMWHELGHALSCKRFGGEVHDIGFTLFYFEPAFYCKIDDAYTFPRLGDRLWAVFGGPYFELMMTSLAMAVWLTTPAELWLHGVALSVVFVSGISVLFNFNPLLKLDGYYALMDWLGVPDLREDSFEYLGNLFKRHVLRLTVPDKAIPRRRRRIYLGYGITAIAYTTLILLALYALARRYLVGWFGPAGYLILFAALAYMMRSKLSKGARFARYFWLDKREALLRGRRPWIAGSVLIALVVLLTVPRTPTRVTGSFVVEPGQRAVVRVTVPGRVADIAVVEGAMVQAGQVVGVLESADVSAEYELASADVERARRLVAEARAAGDLVGAAERDAEAVEAGSRKRMMEDRVSRLALRSPLSGVVTTPDVELARGRFLEEGDELCTVDRLDTVRLALAVSEVDAQQIAVGTPLRLRARAYPGRSLRAEVRSIAPLATPPSEDEEARLDLVQRVHVMRVLVEIDNEDGRLRPGMSGKVQFLTRPRSVAGKIWWRYRRWFASIVW